MDQQQEPSSWFWNWTFAALFGWGGAHAWTLAQGAGTGWMFVACGVSWFLAFSKGMAGLHAWDNAAVLRDARKHIHQQAEKSTAHGAAHWSTPSELNSAGMFKTGGFFLGQVGGKDLFHNGEGSLLTIAGAGMGKTTSLAIPLLLRAVGASGKVTGNIAVDVKLELWLTTRRQRERMGERVVVISPWHQEFSDQFEGRIETWDDGFDPCSFLEASPSILDDCRLLSGLLLPQQGSSTETDSFFRDGAIDVLMAFMLLGLSKSNRITLPDLRADIMAPKEAMAESIATMLGSDAFSGALAELGARLATPFTDAPKEMSGMLSGARRALAVYDQHGPLGRSVRKPGFDFRTFRDKPTTVYIAIPLDKIGTHGSTWLATVITVAQELIGRDRRPTQVNVLLDEFQNLGRQDSIRRGLATLRGAGFRYWFLVQYASALASNKLYGQDWRDFIGCEVVSAFGATSAWETLQLLSNLAGQETFAEPSFSEQANPGKSGGAGLSSSLSTQGRPLIRPADIKTLLGKDGHLIFAGTLPPILAKKVSYLSVRKWRRLADPNPYYTKR